MMYVHRHGKLQRVLPPIINEKHAPRGLWALITTIALMVLFFCGAWTVQFLDDHVAPFAPQLVADPTIKHQQEGDYSSCSKQVLLANGTRAWMVWYEVGDICHAIAKVP
jgi:hypothetical protein